MKGTKIFIQLEKNGRYIQKKLTKRMICALFDLQYMMDETWDTVELNKMDKELRDFFRIIEHVDDAIHGNEIGITEPAKQHIGDNKVVQQERKVVWRKKEDGEYLFGKPRWRKIKCRK